MSYNHKRFSRMTDEEIMQEYMRVLRRKKHLNESFTRGLLSEDDFLEELEPLCEAEDYLAGYLARLHCYQWGFVKIEGL